MHGVCNRINHYLTSTNVILTMPLFMDIHVINNDNFSAEDVERAHLKDIAVQ